MFSRFWQWYERHYTFNVTFAAALFLLQIVHLYWLTTHVVALRLFGISFFDLIGIWKFVMVFVDYTEIPAIIITSLVYINELRKGGALKNIWFLVALNSQWLHIFWITDEFVITQLVERSTTILPFWLAWIAIGIDYLELPVIFNMVKRFFIQFNRKSL